MLAIFAFLLAGLGFFLRPFVLLKMYGYFIVAYFPLAPVISFWGMVGVSMFLHLIINGLNIKDISELKEDKTWEEHCTDNFINTLTYLLIWGFSYLVTLGM